MRFHKSLLHKILYQLIYHIFKYLIPLKLKKIILNSLRGLTKKNSLDYSWRVPLKFLDKLKKKRFRSFRVLIPHKSKEYISFRYGKDWMTPRSNWNPWTEDKTITAVNKK